MGTGGVLIEKRTVTLAELETALRASWSPATAAPGYGTGESGHTAAGQCAVTALVIQDCLGGDILRAVVRDGSHYWNRLPDGTEIDLTRDQFALFRPDDVRVRTREEVLASPDTALRYKILASRVAATLASNVANP